MVINDLRIFICLRKSDVSVERISVGNLSLSLKYWQSMAYKLGIILRLQCYHIM